MGTPYGGFNDEIRQMVLEACDETEVLDQPAEDSLAEVKEQLETTMGREISDKEAVSYRLYPKVWLDFQKHNQVYGETERVPTDIFFYGIEENKEIEIEIEPGKTLYISLSGMTQPDDQGLRRLFFQLNGFPRALEIEDESASSNAVKEGKG